MSALTGLFISQSYGGVIHLSTNTGIVPSTPTLLEDGFGNSLGLFIRSNGSISGSSFTGSLAGTASFAIHAQTASFALNATSNFPTDITVAGAQIGRMTSSLSTNLLFGSGSLTRINTTLAQRNIVIGDQSLYNNITSSNNIVVGHQSLQNWNGNNGAHIAIGNNIAERLTGPSANGMVMIGFDVLSSATSHSFDHTAIGYGVLFSHISGTYNVGIGQDTLTTLTSGSNNVAIGGQAMELVPVSSNTTAIGYEAGFDSRGNGNIFLGTRAGRDISGSFNTFIGTDNYGIVGYNFTGSNNTFIGSRINAGVGNKQLENNIIIATGAGSAIVWYQNDGSFNIYGNPTIIHADTTVVGYISQSRIDIWSTGLNTGYNPLPAMSPASGSRLAVSSSGDLFFAKSGSWGQVVVGGNSGEFWSTNSQSGSAGISGSVSFNNSGSVFGTSVVSNNRLTVTRTGTYNIQFSAQIETSAGADTMYVWYRKNGVNIPASNTKVVLANNTAQVMTVNILDEANANDYYQINYQTVSGHATLKAEAATGNLPAIPSVIATITQIR
jgi:hypothetical protein